MKTLTRITLVTLTLAAALASQAQNYITGTSRTFGNTTYHNYYDSNGGSVSGTTRTYGRIAYQNLYDFNGRSVSGTSRTFGNTTYTTIYNN